VSERQQQERDALSAHRSYETRALRLPNAQKGLHFVVGFARAEADDERCHRRRRVVGFDHRRDLWRAIREPSNRVTLGSGQRTVGTTIRIRRLRDAAPARAIAHGAEATAAAARIVHILDNWYPAATDLDNGHVARCLAAMPLTACEPDPKAGKAACDKDQDGKESDHGIVKEYATPVQPTNPDAHMLIPCPLTGGALLLSNGTDWASQPWPPAGLEPRIYPLETVRSGSFECRFGDR
jgi:hypothetical protein